MHYAPSCPQPARTGRKKRQSTLSTASDAHLFALATQTAELIPAHVRARNAEEVCTLAGAEHARLSLQPLFLPLANHPHGMYVGMYVCTAPQRSALSTFSQGRDKDKDKGDNDMSTKITPVVVDHGDRVAGVLSSWTLIDQGSRRRPRTLAWR